MGDKATRKELIDQMQFLGQMSSTETAMFHQTAAAKVGLGISDMKTISILLQEGAMTAGQLAQRLSLTTGGVTNVVNRLEQRGFVSRTPDPEDRRKVIVIVNRDKLALTDQIYRSMGEAFEKLLAAYTMEELQFLVDYLRATIEMTMLESAKLTRLRDIT